MVKLKTVEDVQGFFDSRNDPKYSLSTVMVVGFFSDHEEIEEDEYEDFIEAAEALQVYADIYIGVVTSKKTCQWYKTEKHIDRTPSLHLLDPEGQGHSLNLDDFYGERMNIKDWILHTSIPLVGKLHGANFALYEKLNLPMLMLFLDLENEHLTTNSVRSVGGKSGGILNENLLEELRIAGLSLTHSLTFLITLSFILSLFLVKKITAKDHRERIAFVYLDGNEHIDQMKSLGLYGGKERLPSLAFNTKVGFGLTFA